jgi:tetratricopeptide (TPR) repeat protein
MKKTTFVAFLLLLSNLASAKNITSEINNIESQWANIYYAKTITEQSSGYIELLAKTEKLAQEHPRSAELMIWKAIIISTNAAFDPPFTALESIDKAKALLELSIKKNPNALDGAAFVALGTLYYLTPGWPISYGDFNIAEQLLKKGLIINPDSIDANYFYADYLLSKDKITEASKYFKLALKAPVRAEQLYADTQLKNEALIALEKTEQRKLNSGKNKFLSLFYSANSN